MQFIGKLCMRNINLMSSRVTMKLLTLQQNHVSEKWNMCTCRKAITFGEI
jgi:hypothetical protein